MNSYGPLVLATLIYMWLTYECFQNPVSLQGFASGITNLGGLTKGFGEEVSVATAWSHFLAEDLFIGRWVYLDGQRNKIFTKHSLVLCYLFGPAGFLSHLLTRGVTSVVKPGVRDIMQQQPTKSSPKTPPSGTPSSTLGREAKELITKAKREAEEILQQARSTGAAQAASLLEVGTIHACHAWFPRLDYSMTSCARRGWRSMYELFCHARLKVHRYCLGVLFCLFLPRRRRRRPF